ncbi:transmembrane reductase CYB561D2-like [Portunus trituberculatus]|uniref:transmembrane reductase CYB561D2-like n=1 Tax=Portunus trituberculatus TaxID=210409 RepID=UPI001E1CFE8C|nr:transmembrane reductase CYB561D2-like [Portunus trituberculatus]
MAAAAAAAVRVGVCIFLVFITYLARPGSSLFSWHPFLMSLAFTGLMSEAVSIFTRHSLASGRPHSTKITAHWALLAAAAAAHGLGYAAIYYTKESKNKPHLTSWHGLLGLATSILLWGQVTIGVVAKYPKVVEKFVSLRSIRSGHSLSGSLCFCLGMVCVCVSCWSDWFQGGAEKLGDFGVWCVWGVVSLHVVLLCVVCKRHVTRYVWK